MTYPKGLSHLSIIRGFPSAGLNWFIQKAEFLAFAGLLGAFLGLETYCFRSPGLIPDGDFLNWEYAERVVELLREGSSPTAIAGGHLPLYDASFRAYHGRATAFLYMPLVALIGNNWIFMRFLPTLLALISLSFFYLFVRHVTDKKTALLALLLTVLHPPYVMAVKVGWYYVSILQVFSTGCLYCLSRWWTTRRGIFLFTGLALLGLGLGCQIWFFWFFTSLLASSVLFGEHIHERLGLSFRREWLRVLGWGGTGFVFGSFFLWYREIFQGFPGTVRLLSQLLAPGNAAGPARFFENLQYVVDYFNKTLTGITYFREHFSVDAAPFANLWYPWFLWGGILWGILAALQRRRYGEKPLFWASFLFIAMLVQTPIGPGHLPDLHLFFLYPFPQAVIGLAISHAFRCLGGARLGKGLLLLIMLAFVSKEVYSLGRYVDILKTKGGASEFTDSINDLADWLARPENRRKNVFAVNSSNVRLNLKLFQPGQIKVREIWGPPLTSKEEEDTMWVRMEKEFADALFLRIHSPSPMFNPENYWSFLKLAGRHGKTLRRIRLFKKDTDRTGFEVLALAPQ